MKRYVAITVMGSALLGLVSFVVSADDGALFFKNTPETLHCVSGYTDCGALVTCVAAAQTRAGEAECIGLALSPLVEKDGFEIDAGQSATPPARGLVPEGQQVTAFMLGSVIGDFEVLSAPNDPLVIEGAADGVRIVAGRGAIIDPVKKTIHAFGPHVEAEPTDGGDAGVDGDAGVSAPAGEVPQVAGEGASEPQVDLGQFPDAEEELVDKPFSKGDMEVSLGIGLAGDGSASYLGVGGKYAYYVIDRLAPGLDLHYTHIFVDDSLGYDYPDSMTLLPFLKFVISQKSVAPYVFVKGGYEFEWGTSEAVNAWVLGLGGGVHVAIGKRFTINIELAGLHYWYSDTKQYWYDDDDMLTVDENRSQKVVRQDCLDSPDCTERADTEAEPAEGEVVLLGRDGTQYTCTDPLLCGEETVRDKKDVSREWFFPLVTLGVGFFF